MVKATQDRVTQISLLSDFFVFSIADKKLLIYNSFVGEGIYFIGKKQPNIKNITGSNKA